MAPDAQRWPGQTQRTTSSLLQTRVLYLTLYNILFAVLWAFVGITAILHASEGKFVLFETIEPRARWIQTLTIIEVVHAAIGTSRPPPDNPSTDQNPGVVKAPVSTTAIQVFARVIQVWLIWYSFPASTASSHAFLVLVLAWSLADSIRYLYLALNLHKKAPKALLWLRYVTFTLFAQRY